MDNKKKLMKPELSIIMPYHNEGKAFVLQTIDSIETTIDVTYEIIVVDDCSDEPLKIDGVKVIRHKKNKGVGCAFDTGVEKAKSNNIFLMGSDIRFIANNWASKMVAEISKYPKALICTATIPLQYDYPEIDFETAKKYSKLDSHKGASILFFMGSEVTRRDIIEAQWMPREFLPLRSPNYIPPTECYDVACILGAAYGCTKEWYKDIDGFWGHKVWGCLEPLISLKSILFGGQCLVAPHIETAHIFNPGEGKHTSQYNYWLYKTHNRLLVCWLLMKWPDKERLINWLGANEIIEKAKDMIAGNKEAIMNKRETYRKKMVMNIEDFVSKYNLTF
jgi:glycosyltransferase involved in cell wall biosynthesis